MRVIFTTSITQLSLTGLSMTEGKYYKVISQRGLDPVITFDGEEKGQSLWLYCVINDKGEKGEYNSLWFYPIEYLRNSTIDKLLNE